MELERSDAVPSLTIRRDAQDAAHVDVHSCSLVLERRIRKAANRLAAQCSAHGTAPQSVAQFASEQRRTLSARPSHSISARAGQGA